MARIARRIAGIGASDLQDAAAFDAYVGPAREITVDQQRGIIALHDGFTQGGQQFFAGWNGGAGASAIDPIPKSFVGKVGVNQTYLLDLVPSTAANVLVYVGGIRQIPTVDYTVSGATLTILDNPDGLEVDTLLLAGPYTLTDVPDASVTEAKLALEVAEKLNTANDNAVTAQTAVNFLSETVEDIEDRLLVIEAETNVVANRVVLKALPTTTPAAVYLAEAGRQGIFVFRSGDYSTHVALDTLEGVYVKATDVAASVGCWVRHLNERQLLNIKWFGAIGDNVNNDRPAIDAAFALAKAYHGGLYLPKGLYSYDLGGAVATWDFSDVQYGFTIEGDGLSITEIRVINPTAMAGNLGINWVSSGPQYDKTIKGFAIRGEFNGCVLALGKNDVTDSFETSYFERFGVINQHAGGTQSEALRLNFVLGCTFINSRVGCYANVAGVNYGTALRLRQACFNTFVNFDYGNGEMGIDFTDFGSYGNVFLGGGSENCHWHVSIRSSLATRNKWIGGRYSLWTQYAVRATAGSDNVFEDIKDNNGAGPATFLDPANYTGVIIKDGRTVSTPAMPASGTAITNTTGKTVMVRLGGGAYTVVGIGGFNMSRASNGDWTSWLLPAGQTISVTYTSAPSWSWLSPNF